MSILEILKVIVLGMVEGFTEWLPISSTGHLILVEDLIRPEVSAEFMEMFRVVIQLGAILAVVVMYFRRLNPFDPGKSRRQRAATWQLWMKILIACLPAAILGFLLDDWLDEHLFNGFVVALMLVLYGILFIVIENMNRFRQPVIRLGQAGSPVFKQMASQTVQQTDSVLFTVASEPFQESDIPAACAVIVPLKRGNAVSVRTNYRNGFDTLRIQGQDAVILQQHHALFSGFQGKSGMLVCIVIRNGNAVIFTVIRKQTEQESCSKQPFTGGGDVFFGNQAFL